MIISAIITDQEILEKWRTLTENQRTKIQRRFPNIILAACQLSIDLGISPKAAGKLAFLYAMQTV